MVYGPPSLSPPPLSDFYLPVAPDTEQSRLLPRRFFSHFWKLFPLPVAWWATVEKKPSLLVFLSRMSAKLMYAFPRHSFIPFPRSVSEQCVVTPTKTFCPPPQVFFLVPPIRPKYFILVFFSSGFDRSTSSSPHDLFLLCDLFLVLSL